MLRWESVMKATLRKIEPGDQAGLLAMYEEFDPKGEFQGLPPRSRETTERWLAALREAGDGECVIEVNKRIVGHCLLCLDASRTEAELAIFVHQDFRGLGLGRKLLLGALHHGCKVLQLDRVVLSVQGSNPRAVHLFESVGFRPCGAVHGLQWELEMARLSNCERCKEDRCILFGQSLPMTVTVAKHKSSCHAN
jgi:RimJ/RimL family protein N-acetyltransferase